MSINDNSKVISTLIQIKERSYSQEKSKNENTVKNNK